MVSDIVLTVDEGRSADAARFFAAGTHLLELLDDLVETASVEWVVADLRRSSAEASLEAVGEFRPAGVQACHSAVRGLTLIRDGDRLPDDWAPDAFGHGKELVYSAGEHSLLRAGDNVVPLDRRLRAQINEIAPWIREFHGSVRGELTGVNVTRGNRASVKPQGGGRVVRVGFPMGLAEQMKDGLLKFVEVEGQVRQNEDGRTYYVTAEAVRVVDEPTLSWRDLRGYMPEITEGLSVADYLEQIRGKD